MKSFDPVFKQSENLANSLDLETEVFKSFRDRPGPYHFLTATKTQFWQPDQEALDISKSIDSVLFEAYLKKEKPLTGYSNKDCYVPLDEIDSRHIMMSSIIFSKLGTQVDNIVEIGAGFGNWVRLNHGIINYNSWTMIDLEFVTKLQKWYVNQTVRNTSNIHYISSDTEQYNKWIENPITIDLVIGAHSLSEFSLPVFETYYNDILAKTKYLFYATHNTKPAKSLVVEKLKMLDKLFNPIISIKSKGGKVSNILYQRKENV